MVQFIFFNKVIKENKEMNKISLTVFWILTHTHLEPDLRYGTWRIDPKVSDWLM